MAFGIAAVFGVSGPGVTAAGAAVNPAQGGGVGAGLGAGVASAAADCWSLHPVFGFHDSGGAFVPAFPVPAPDFGKTLPPWFS